MKKIVVVEDQPVLARIYRDKFLAEGFQVEVASDGEQALEVIKLTKPDLVLLDLMLPKVKGIDVLKTLRANDSFKAIPILVFSNSSLPGTVEEAWKAGATMVLSKSDTSPSQMVESVHHALATSVSAGDVDQAKATAGEVDKRPAAITRTGRILFVENNPESGAIISHLLTRGGHQIAKAENQAEALQLAQANEVDLVLINRALCQDVSTFCQQMRQQHPSLPLVIYSMDASAEEAEEAVGGGISKFLSTPEQLLDVAQILAGLIPEVARASKG